MHSHTQRNCILSLSLCTECEILSPCSDCDGGYMDMNKEEGAQYVAMKELSYADIELEVYETPYTPTGETCSTLCTITTSVTSEHVHNYGLFQMNHHYGKKPHWSLSCVYSNNNNDNNNNNNRENQMIAVSERLKVHLIKTMKT